MHPKITVTILGYKSREVLPSCLDSLAAQDYPNLEIVFIDNNSQDGSEEFVRSSYPDVRVIQTGDNTGYAKGHNIGIREAGGEFVCFLNPDTELSVQYFSELIKPLLSNPTIAGAQSKLLKPEKKDGKYIFDSAGIVVERSRRFHDRGQLEEDNGQYDTPQEVFAITGAAPLYRKSALLDVAIDGEVMDEGFFMYWEDVDLCWRLRHRGWKLWYQPSSVGYHGRGAGKSPGGYKKVLSFIKHHKKLSPMIRKLNWKNHLFVIVKNDGGWPFMRDLPFIAGREIAMMIFILIFETKTLAVVPTFLRQLPGMYQKRKQVRASSRMSSAMFDRWIN